MPGAEVVLAYPGIRLRDDVYATHGHYLDMHLTVPRVGVRDRFGRGEVRGRGRPRRAGGTRTPTRPRWRRSTPSRTRVVQRSESRAITRGANLSRSVWSRASPGGRRSITGVLMGRLGIPAAVGALNLLGLGPYRSDISAEELRRAGLRAMAETIHRLGVVADHVIFGHTHRAGPLPGEVEGWLLPGGTRLHNTGSWLHERVFLGDGQDPANPYWPGNVTLLGDDGPPELRNVLRDVELELSLSEPWSGRGGRLPRCPSPAVAPLLRRPPSELT